MSERNFETEIALLLLAVFVFLAIALLGVEHTALVRGWAGFFAA